MLIFFKYQSGLGGQSDLTEALQGQLLRRGLLLPPVPGQEVLNFMLILMFVWLYCRGRINVNKGICKIQFSAQNNFMMECNMFNILGRKPNQPRHSPRHLEAQGRGHIQDNNMNT